MKKTSEREYSALLNVRLYLVITVLAVKKGTVRSSAGEELESKALNLHVDTRDRTEFSLSTQTE